MNVGILYPRGPHNLHLLGKSLFKLALKEAQHLAELQVHHILLQALRVPQCQADAFGIDLGLQVVRDEVAGGRRFRAIVVFGSALGSLLCGQSERRLEKLEEGGLARIGSADNENTAKR